MRILIVDDSSDMRERIRCTLAPLEPEFFECADGDEALARFAEFRPDWTIMDFQMPNLDGLTTTRLLRQRWPEAHIFLLTFSDSPAIREEALRLGALDCVTKENIHTLLESIGTAVLSRTPGS